MMSERESHGMNCAHRSDSDEPCTCACRYHAAVDTERTMHAAWRKRAEEAERENADLRARLEAAEKAARIIDTMPVDGCSPSCIESMLRQAKTLCYKALSALDAKGGG